jgi:hypothetical protein
MSKSIRSPIIRVLGTLVAAVLISTPGIAAQTGSVTGRVTDAQTGLPVARVQVFIFDQELGGLSQQNGRYLLQNVPAGTHTLTVDRIGFRLMQVQIVVAGNQTVEQNFAISYEAPAQPYPTPANTPTRARLPLR